MRKNTLGNRVTSFNQSFKQNKPKTSKFLVIFVLFCLIVFVALFLEFFFSNTSVLYNCPNNNNVKISSDAGPNWQSLCPNTKILKKIKEKFIPKVADPSSINNRGSSECISYQCPQECYLEGSCSSEMCQKCIQEKCPLTDKNSC